MEKIKRITEFRKLGWGMFLHFGLYNQLGQGEWYQEMYHLTSQQYYALFPQLSEIELKLNVAEIVGLAKRSGMRYIVLTTKHHDGFCLFDSHGISVNDCTKTATKTDLLQIFVTECLKNGIQPFFYYATLDWSWDEAKIPFAKQLTMINEEVKILCQTYPEVVGFWFDGNWSKKDADWQAEKLYSLIRSLIPEAIIINNSGLANAGKEQSANVDVLTFEQGHLKEINYQQFQRDWGAEACQSFTDHWGIATEDYHYKSLTDLILKFVAARKQKANYLLNMSLNGDGDLLPIEVETVKVFGNWIKKYGFMFFDDYQVWGINGDDFLIKTSKNEYFAFLHDLPSGGHVKIIQTGGKIQQERSFKLVEPIPKLEKMTFLDNNEEIQFQQKTKQLIIAPTAFNYGFNTVVRVLKILTK